MGLASLHALGLYPGRVERTDRNIAEYERIKEFFVTLFENSVKKGCKIMFPVDFVTGQKDSLENIVASGAAQRHDDAASNHGAGAQKSQRAGDSQQLIDVAAESGDDRANNVSLMTLDPNFRPSNWTDARFYYKQTSLVDLETLVHERFERIVKHQRALSRINSGDPLPAEA